MGWTERQQAMLQAMGLRLWSPPESVDAEAEPQVANEVQAAREAPPAALPEPTSAAAAVAALLPTHTPARATPRTPASPAPVVAADADAETTARAARIATLDWPALRDAAAACRACGLGDTRTQPVFGVGAAQAHWMVVGEAPGEQEDLKGEPFVGPSGELLDAMLRALGLTRAAEGPQPPAQRVYIANTIKCRPPSNRNPSPEELRRCEPFLVRQIQLVQPRIILAMGRFAVQSLLRTDEPVGKLRGRVHRYQGVPLIVTYHPAYLLRNPPDKARAWDDLCLAAATAEAAG